MEERKGRWSTSNRIASYSAEAASGRRLEPSKTSNRGGQLERNKPAIRAVALPQSPWRTRPQTLYAKAGKRMKARERQ